ncbi:GATA transcription factor 2-like [Punica granatum]|uniref:GATA transcription factor n=2 Tax=Punica granatum TaxID=22663 RepID=A0A6P8CZT3_PUNGR|nr:GATA transcription factor 2-like [Punica granatum]
MDVYGMSSSTPDHVFRIDDLLDLSNGDLFSSTLSAASTSDDSLNALSTTALPPPPPPPLPDLSFSFSSSSSPAAPIFPDDFSFTPSDDVAELEWVSRFVDDSLSDVVIPANSVAGTLAVRPDATAFSGKPRTKRSRPVCGNGKLTEENSADAGVEAAVRRCTHCASESTPQWRTGPQGPKTLCNACGVRYKSGRLVPEYRPAASPTFVLTQHSNSHRKVMELRRQKELSRQEQHYRYQQQQQHDFQVC